MGALYRMSSQTRSGASYRAASRSRSRSLDLGHHRSAAPSRESSMSRRRDPSIPLPALKRLRYGKDTGKFKLSSTAVFRLNYYTVSLWQTTTVATDPDVACVPLSLLAHGPWVGPDIICDDPVTFREMDVPRLTAYDTTVAPFFKCMNTFQALGGNWAWSQVPATVQNPFFDNFLAFKLDFCGFNANETVPFNTLCQQFGLCKQGPTCMTLMFTDGPVGVKVSQTTSVFPVQQVVGTIGGQDANWKTLPFIANHETRPLGRWEYIIVPPRVGASVNITQLMSNQNWDKLIDMGFKAHHFVGNNGLRLYCSPKGQVLSEYTSWQSPIVTTPPTPAPAATDTQNAFTSQASKPKISKGSAGWSETERICQFAHQGTSFFAPVNWNQSLSAQGYPVIAFGSAVCIRFRQYAPIHCALDPDTSLWVYSQTAVQKQIPVEIQIDTVCKFKMSTMGLLDLDQVATVPVAPCNPQGPPCA